MATETQARIARDRILDEAETLFGMYPRAVGIVASAEGDHWIKVTLPRGARQSTTKLGGVRVVYDIAKTPAELVGAREAPWMAAVRRAQGKAR
jgi:hypothetical protein